MPPARRRTTARVAALPARRRRAPTPALGRLLPSGRSLLVGLAILALAGGAYALARETSVFAVRTLDVRGGSPAVRQEVRAALAPELGRSLVALGRGELAGRLATLPSVASFEFDRAFPHTLRVTIRAERGVLLLRVGKQAYLVAADGRVLSSVARPRRSSFTRVWLPATTTVTVGAMLHSDVGGAAAAALGVFRGNLGASVRTASTKPDEVTLTLASGFELRLGDTGDLRLKLAIARRILALKASAARSPGYLDVSVPERPVLFSNPKVGG